MHQGQYEFNCVPFGLCNYPAVFQRYINHARFAIPRQRDYTSRRSRRRIGKIETFFQEASQSGLSINWKKYQLLHSKVEFLGYEVEISTIKLSETKTHAIKYYPEPTSLKQVQAFLFLPVIF